MQPQTDTPSTAPDPDALDALIRGRRTSKRLRDPDEARTDRAPLDPARRAELDAMLAVAGEAPFHRRVDDVHRGGELGSAVPWRFHVLERPACLALLDALEARANAEPASKWARAWKSKIPELLAGAGALVQVTWLPDPAEGDGAGSPPALTERNVEHVAAASAAVQNLLLAATARGWSSYWSSGGILRDADAFALLGIDPAQALLGAIVLGAPDAPHTRDIPGGLREERADPAGWMRKVRADAIPGGAAQPPSAVSSGAES